MPATRIGTYSQIKGQPFKLPVRVATTGSNITLSGTQTIDSVALSVGDRVLVKDQSTGANNGIYIVQSGAWTRAMDMSLDDDVYTGLLVYSSQGSTNGDSFFELTTTGTITLGVTALTFAKVSGVSSTAGTSGTSGSSGSSGTRGTSGSSGLAGACVDIFIDNTDSLPLTVTGFYCDGTAITDVTIVGSSSQLLRCVQSNTLGYTQGVTYTATIQSYCQGTSGTRGTSGSSGSSSTAGTAGSSGSSGSSGTFGTRGTSGSSGSSGSAGTSGVSPTATSGTSGSSGSSGSAGTSGISPTATSGTSGSSGSSGSAGSAGTRGTAGSSGSSGSAGTSGVTPAATNGTSGTSASGSISGTLNYIAKFSPNGTSLGNSGLVDDGTSISYPASTTETRALEIGAGRSGNGSSFIDLIGDATYTDYGLRIIRNNTGANTNSDIIHRGTGKLLLRTQDAGDVQIWTSDTSRVSVTSGGQTRFIGVAVNLVQIGDENYGTLNNVQLVLGIAKTPDYGVIEAARWGVEYKPIALNPNGSSVLIGTTTEVTNSILTMSSTTKGMLTPRMTASQRSSISTPNTGLLLYQTDEEESFWTKKAFEWKKILTEDDQIGWPTTTGALWERDLIWLRGNDVGFGNPSSYSGANTNWGAEEPTSTNNLSTTATSMWVGENGAYHRFRLRFQHILRNNGYPYIFRYRLQTKTDGTNFQSQGIDCTFGVVNVSTALGDPDNNSAWFEHTYNGSNQNNWSCKTKTGGSTTTTNTSVTVLNSLTPREFRIEINIGTNVKFYIDDTLVATHTTNLPAADSIVYGAFWYLDQNVASSNKTYLNLINVGFEVPHILIT